MVGTNIAAAISFRPIGLNVMDDRERTRSEGEAFRMISVGLRRQKTEMSVSRFRGTCSECPTKKWRFNWKHR